MDDAIYAALGDVFNDVFGRPIALKPETTAVDVPGWDSFKQIEIIMAVEERFVVRLGVRDIESLKCVGDLAHLIEART